MAGHGSPPPADRANHPGRQVGRGEYFGATNLVSGQTYERHGEYSGSRQNAFLNGHGGTTAAHAHATRLLDQSAVREHNKITTSDR